VLYHQGIMKAWVLLTPSMTQQIALQDTALHAHPRGRRLTAHFGRSSSHFTLRVLHVQHPKRERGGRRAVEDLPIESPFR